MDPIYLNLGAGGNQLPPPWRNHDMDMDLRTPLPFADGTVDLIFAEHCVEHITPTEAWRFFKECRRVLKPGGVLRIAVPSIEKVWAHADGEYLLWMSKAGFGEASGEAAVENQIVNHGHQALWSEDLLHTCFAALGFAVSRTCSVDDSPHHPALRGIHGHGKVIGERNNAIETICVEGVK